MEIEIRRTYRFSAVYVVQFLRPEDKKTGTVLYEKVIEPAGKLGGVHCEFFDIGAKSELLRALEVISKDCEQNKRGRILHLETHGDQNGIGTDLRKWTTWAELKPSLTRLNVAGQAHLLVTMAACHGLNIVKALWPTERSPM